MKDIKRFLFLPVLLAVCAVTFAVPAKRGQWRTVTLADGSEVRVELRGDEFGSFWQAEDGQRFIESARKGVYEEADIKAIASRAAQKRQAVSKQRTARTTAARRAAGAATQGSAYIGERRALIILAEFTDVKFDAAHTHGLYERIANEAGFSEMGFNGSIHDYFLAQSYGKFDLTFDVAGPIELPENCAYYGNNDSGESWDVENVGQMVLDACTAADEQFDLDFTQYDWDGDGWVDQVYILYAGYGEASNQAAVETIWPHEYAVSGALGYQYYYNPTMIDGKGIDTYACGCELNGYGGLDGIGTLCHEFSHCLGLPDMYDSYYSGDYGLGDWSIMASGSYNDNSMTPAGMTSYERMACGWLTPTELNADLSVASMPALGSGDGTGEAYIIYNDGNSDEYYLLENRQQEGWDEFLPNSGMLILHVDYDQLAWDANVVNSSGGQRQFGYMFPNPHERCGIIQADASSLMNFARGDVWPYGARNALTATSNPAATVYNMNTDGSYNMNKSVTAITRNTDGTISFIFSVDVPTGFDNVIVDPDESADRRIYSVDGRYLGTDETKLGKGLYIRDGKKFIKR